ncbi:hypothetical protein GCM10023333_24310 [Ferrimonas pelagia]|uniref:Uncharacterized protein n=2 Tax=Ferrimonas pelagia TaxID=1177826 RepID=A0ABP9F7X6_9GAMM
MVALSLITFGMAPTASANEATLPDIGIYQGSLESTGAGGGMALRLEFDTNGTVVIEQKYYGQDLRHEHNWSVRGDRLVIEPDANSPITLFDKAIMVIADEKLIEVDINVPASTFELVPEDAQFSLHKWSAFAAYSHIFLTLIILIALNELFRHYAWTGWAFFLGFAAIATIWIWPYTGISHWFKWAKIYSVVGASVFFLCMRFTPLWKYKWAKFGAASFLAINILEAVMQDFSMGHIPNVLNGTAGILSIITCYYGWKGIHTDNSPQKDMVWPLMTGLWIIAYDVWNIVYVYLNFPTGASAHAAVILAATIPAAFIKKGTWLQARAFTLAAWFMYYFSFPLFYSQNMWILPRSETSSMLVASLSLILNIACVFQLYYFYKKGILTFGKSKKAVEATA